MMDLLNDLKSSRSGCSATKSVSLTVRSRSKACASARETRNRSGCTHEKPQLEEPRRPDCM